MKIGKEIVPDNMKDLYDWLFDKGYVYQYDILGHQLWKSLAYVLVIHPEEGIKFMFSNIDTCSKKVYDQMIERLITKKPHVK